VKGSQVDRRAVAHSRQGPAPPELTSAGAIVASKPACAQKEIVKKRIGAGGVD
jgi:hypothetical protein